MRLFSFRRRARLQRILTIGGITLAVLAIVYLIAVIYSGRFIIYSRSGAYADQNWRTSMTATTERKTSDITPHVTVLPKTTVNTGTVRRLSGCYISTEQLTNLGALRTEIKNKGYGTVVIEMKDCFGNFFYDTTIPDVPRADGINTSAVASFIKELKDSGCYLIASVPALADQSYCLNHVELGLPLKSGALWVDDKYCYWMDPKLDGTLSYLETICLELSNLGFREVLLKDFYFPLDDTIVYPETDGSKADVLKRAVERLQADLGSSVTLSFGLGSALTFPASLENGRLYMNTVHDGNAVPGIVSQLNACVQNPEIQLVFITGSEDQNLDSFGHIIPIQASAPEGED